MAAARIIADRTGLGAAVEEAMQRRGLRQGDLASGARVDQSQVSRVMRGDLARFTPNVERVCEYARVDAEPYLAPRTVRTSRLERLVRAAGAGEPERETIVAQILMLLAKLR